MQRGTKRRWSSLIEAGGVFLLIMIYIWRLRFDQPWLGVVILGFVAGTHFLHGEGARWIGFGWSEFRRAFASVIPWAVVIVLALLGMGVFFGTLRKISALEAVDGVLAYIAWGLCQQYLLNGYFVNRFLEHSGVERNRFAPLVAAILFSIAHLPNWFLMLVALAGGYVCTRVYLRHRSLYVLGLAHGLVAFCLFLTVPDAISEHFFVGPRYLLGK